MFVYFLKRLSQSKQEFKKNPKLTSQSTHVLHTSKKVLRLYGLSRSEHISENLMS